MARLSLGRAPSKICAIALVSLLACSQTSFVERITFVNNGAFPAEVAVSGSPDSGWVGIGVALDNERTVFEEVLDQGEGWVFRFDYVGKHQVELEISRSELEESGWTVEVPPEFDAKLRELGYSPSP